MIRKEILGGWYGFSTIGGGWAALIGDRNHASHIESSEGRIELPLVNGQPDNVLYLAGAMYQSLTPPHDRFLVMGGQSHGAGHAWLYWRGRWFNVGGAFGVSMAAFSQDGRFMYVADSSTTGYYRDMETLEHTPFSTLFYTDGIRAIIPPTNKLILGNTTQSDPVRRISEYIDFENGLIVGQGATGLLTLSSTRRVIEPGGTFFIRAQFDGTNIALATAKQLEQPQRTVFHWLTMNELPQFPLEGAAEPMPVIGKPCYLGWYEWKEPPQHPPGNCLLRVHELLTIKRFDGTQFAQQVMGDTVEAIEAQCVDTPYPPVAYWDARYWPRWPALPTKSWLGIQAYCARWETPADFEASMRRVLNGAPAGQQVALICQCYTSNTDNTADLASLVPVYARLAKDYASITMLLVFTDEGRESGLNDNPALRPVWQQLADGITGIPQEDPMDNGVVNGVLVDPEKYFRWLVGSDPVSDYINVLRRIGPDLYKYGLGQQNDSGCTPRGRLFLPYAGARDCRPRGNALEQCLGVRQESACWEKTVDVADVPNDRWAWIDRRPDLAYVPISEQPQPQPEVAVLILAYDLHVSRHNPYGGLVRFEAASAKPIIESEVYLEDGDSKHLVQVYPIERGNVYDGRYHRAVAFKPVLNGTWTLRVRAKNVDGVWGQSDGTHRVTVTE